MLTNKTTIYDAFQTCSRKYVFNCLRLIPLTLTYRGKYYVQLPVHFKPTQPGKYESLLVIQSELKGSFAVQLVGEATR